MGGPSPSVVAAGGRAPARRRRRTGPRGDQPLRPVRLAFTDGLEACEVGSSRRTAVHSVRGPRTGGPERAATRRHGRDPASMRIRRHLVLAGLVGVTLTVGLPAVAGQARAADERWAWPVPVGRSAVMHGFAPPDHPWLPGHRGVDLRAQAGALVEAAGPGRVHFAGRIGRMWVVSVLHPDGLLTTYEPVRPLVRRGAWVRRGQPIGRLLRSGSHCGSPRPPRGVPRSP